MLKIPFKNDNTFATEMKPKISGTNLNLEFQNIESSLYKIAADIPNTISQDVYNMLISKFETPTTKKIYQTAIDYLQRAMLHFAIYEHTIFLIAQISNDGIVVKKNENETTIFKYQQDELNNKLITTGWFWINQLIKLMNKNVNFFKCWTHSEQGKSTKDLPIDINDFKKWLGISDEYFMINIAWLIKEVWLDCVKSRLATPTKTDKIARAVCYEVTGRACQVLAYQILPEPLRRDIDNEMGKNERTKAAAEIRERISERFLQKASVYWQDLDLDIKKAEIAANRKNAASQPILGQRYYNENDKFCMV
ncbi:MAG: hypothetical protein LBN95_06475 [Prevotellaceae bacterium]|jgi:hypothetical protein|nr:hypothetical protein [Prevotellaceae bacterium]